jgi:hypothetical protein
VGPKAVRVILRIAEEQSARVYTVPLCVCVEEDAETEAAQGNRQCRQEDLLAVCSPSHVDTDYCLSS